MLSWVLAATIATSPVLVPEVFAETLVVEETQETPFVSIHHPEYAKYRDHIATYMPEGSFCALFVNRMLMARYGIPVYGDAWTMQIHKDNQDWLEMVWKLDEEDFDRKNNLSSLNVEDRVKHYKELYDVIDVEEDPQGILGFVYRFSNYRSQIAQEKPKDALAQTHVSYISGKKHFFFQNTSKSSKTLSEVLTDQYGVIHEFEYDFLSSRVNLATVLEPGDNYFYKDYLIEENFRGIKHGSLLEVFLRKHRNNRITPLLRPNSYSRIKDSVRQVVGAYN